MAVLELKHLVALELEQLVVLESEHLFALKLEYLFVLELLQLEDYKLEFEFGYLNFNPRMMINLNWDQYYPISYYCVHVLYSILDFDIASNSHFDFSHSLDYNMDFCLGIATYLHYALFLDSNMDFVHIATYSLLHLKIALSLETAFPVLTIELFLEFHRVFDFTIFLLLVGSDFKLSFEYFQ